MSCASVDECSELSTPPEYDQKFLDQNHEFPPLIKDFTSVK